MTLKSFNGRCDTPDCVARNVTIDVIAETDVTEAAKLRGVVCEHCRNELTRVFAPSRVNRGNNGRPNVDLSVAASLEECLGAVLSTDLQLRGLGLKPVASIADPVTRTVYKLADIPEGSGMDDRAMN